MIFDSQHYFRAALERLRDADFLYTRERGREQPPILDVLGMYAAGVAIECLFRAFILRRAEKHAQPKHFDSRHDLGRLYRESRMWQIASNRPRPGGLTALDMLAIQRELDAEVNSATRLWMNTYRFFSHKQLETSLRERGLGRGIDEGIVKENYHRLLVASRTILNRGELLWHAWST